MFPIFNLVSSVNYRTCSSFLLATLFISEAYPIIWTATDYYVLFISSQYLSSEARFWAKESRVHESGLSTSLCQTGSEYFSCWLMTRFFWVELRLPWECWPSLLAYCLAVIFSAHSKSRYDLNISFSIISATVFSPKRVKFQTNNKMSKYKIKIWIWIFTIFFSCLTCSWNLS